MIDTLRAGGAEQLVLTTVKHLNGSGIESGVVALFPPLDLQRELERCGVPVYCLGLRGRLDFWRGAVNLARLLRRCRADIVHTHLSYANLYGRIAAFLARVPVVVTSLHFCEYSNENLRRPTVRLRILADRLTGRRMNSLFIAVSNAVRDDYRRHLGLEEIEVLHNYVDIQEFVPPSREARQRMRGALGLADDDFVVVTVGRLHPEKGQEYVVRAMPQVQAAIPRARLLLVGEGPDEARLRAIAAEEGLADVMTFLGSRRDIGKVLAASDVFVFPSIVEALGIALLEAMATGRPVVASGREGILEIVDHGENGLLVEPGDSGQLALAVIRLYENPTLAASLAARARETVAKRFSTEVGIPRIEAIYRRLAARDGADIATRRDLPKGAA